MPSAGRLLWEKRAWLPPPPGPIRRHPEKIDEGLLRRQHPLPFPGTTDGICSRRTASSTAGAPARQGLQGECTPGCARHAWGSASPSPPSPRGLPSPASKSQPPASPSPSPNGPGEREAAAAAEARPGRKGAAAERIPGEKLNFSRRASRVLAPPPLLPAPEPWRSPARRRPRRRGRGGASGRPSPATPPHRLPACLPGRPRRGGSERRTGG